MKKIKEKAMLLGQGWFGVSSSWGGGDFSTYEGTVGKVVQAINAAITLSALVAVIMIVLGAYLLITSGGDAEKAEHGGNAIRNGIIGMIIVFLAGVIIRFVMNAIIN